MRIAVLLSVCAAASFVRGAEPAPDPAAALQARYAASYERLQSSQYLQQIDIESFEADHTSGADVYAVVDHPIVAVSNAFTDPDAWCDALILHFNVKYCRPVSRDERTVLSVALGRIRDQSLRSTHRVEFVYQVVASQPDYLDVELVAPRGPYGTGDYRIALNAVGLENERSFVHLRYSYDYGFVGRLAMQLYLATGGHGKVGFTPIGDPYGPRPEFIGGMRGAIERNSMRYYLAVDAYLNALAAPPGERFEASLDDWFTATERYPRQLHEMDRDAYLTMKRREYARQQADR